MIEQILVYIKVLEYEEVVDDEVEVFDEQVELMSEVVDDDEVDEVELVEV